jgi:hypothetical protein
MNDVLTAAELSNAKRLRQVENEILRRQMEALNIYEPQPEQDVFHRSMASERVIRGGNRSGKSVAAVVEVSRAALGKDPYGKFPEGPLVIWLICYEDGNIGRTAFRLLFQAGAFKMIKDAATGKWRAYRPWEFDDKIREKETKPAGPLIPKRYIESIAYKDRGRRVFSVVRLKNGTEIHAFSSGGEPPQGDPADVIWIDEDLKYDHHVAELQARLSDRKGRLIWSVFPHSKNDALLRMCERAEEQRDRDKPDVQEFRLTFSQNPFIDAEEKRKRFEGWSEDERRARDLGEFLLDSVLVFPNFNIDTHGLPQNADPYGRPFVEQPWEIDRILVKGEIPGDWCRYMVVDPGHTICAVLFAAVPPFGFGDHVVVYDELYLKQCDVDKFARSVSEKTSGKAFYAFIIDDHGSRVRSTSNKTIRQQYSEGLRARRVESETTGSGFIAGSDDIPGRISLVRQWLAIRDDGTTRLRVMRGRCPNLEREFARYKKKLDSRNEILDEPINKNNHLMDCFDSTTEVLTHGGWSKFAALTGTESLATVNLDSDQIEYQQPTQLIAKDHSGDMIAFGGHKMDAMVTPGHRMVVYPKKGYAGYADGRPVVKEAGNLSVWDSVKLHARWDGLRTDEPFLVPRAYNGCGLEKEIDRGMFAEFLGWYIAEGCVSKTIRCPGSGYRVDISQKHGDKRILLESLLGQLPWKWYSTPEGLLCSSKQLWEHLAPLGDCYSKRVPEWIKWSTPEVIRRFMVGAVLGDGWVQKDTRSYATVSPGLADDMQELFIKLGVTASLRIVKRDGYCIKGRTGPCAPQYWLAEWKCPHGSLRDSVNKPNFQAIPYDGKIYCATVPNGTLIVRRNGKPLITGNCLQYLAAYNPKYRKPLESKRLHSTAYMGFQDLMASIRSKHGPSAIHLGPGKN